MVELEKRPNKFITVKFLKNYFKLITDIENCRLKIKKVL